MAAPSRPTKRPTYIVRSLDSGSSASSSSEEDEAEESEEEGVEDEVNDEDEKKGRGRNGSVLENGVGKKAPAIIISLKKVCKVCKEEGHQAGFQGANYIDCPRKPCFLCKMPGHTTMACPHRVALEHGVVPALRKNKQTKLDYVFERQLISQIPKDMINDSPCLAQVNCGRVALIIKIKPTFVVPDKLDRGIVKFHSRRVTSLEFHPSMNSVIISGDKKGQIGIWDYSKPNEKTIYGSIHSCIVNNMKFDTRNDFMLYTSSSDGTISYTDLETGIAVLLIDVNPDGWNGPSTWRMLYGMDSNSDKGLLLAADNFGYIYQFDTREKVKTGEPVLIHRKGSKVVGLHCNPTQPDLLLSCGNDHFAHMWDVRRLETGSFLASLAHTRVVNSAYFSPHTGSKILTTSQDNRIRVWDSVFGNLNLPSREIVHSHDFNRHLTPFRAEWDPKDPSESLAVIGRYISENYNGVALHPIDFIDTSTGHLVAEVIDPDLTTISPVNKLHHRDDILATGSSRSVFIWRLGSKGVKKEVERKKEIMFCNAGKKSAKGKFNESDDDDDDDDDISSKGDKKQQKKYGGKSDKAGSSKSKKLEI